MADTKTTTKRRPAACAEFSDRARLDDGALWPVTYALLELNPEVESRIVALVKRAIG